MTPPSRNRGASCITQGGPLVDEIAPWAAIVATNIVEMLLRLTGSGPLRSNIRTPSAIALLCCRVERCLT